MKIFFDSETATINVRWMPGNCHLPESEYIDLWVAIFKHVEVLKPNYLLIDASDFEYVFISEIIDIFNSISALLNPNYIAIVKSKSILGAKILNELVLNCPHKGHILFENVNEGNKWFNSLKPISYSNK